MPARRRRAPLWSPSTRRAPPNAWWRRRAGAPGCAGFARARDPAHAARLIKLGAMEVIPEAVEASLQLGARVLEGLGIPDEAVARRLDEMRKQELGRLGGEESGAGSRRV